MNAAVVYDNGPINGAVEAWTINYGYQVTDSFTVSSPTTLTGAQIGLWAYPGDSPTSVEWSIGSTPYGSNISSGTSSLSSTFTGGYGFGIYPLFESTFSLTGVLSTGTYWFTLQNAASINGNPVYWDQNNGPSTAFESIEGSIPSESFQLYSGTTVPDPPPSPCSASVWWAWSVTHGDVASRRPRKAAYRSYPPEASLLPGTDRGPWQETAQPLARRIEAGQHRSRTARRTVSNRDLSTLAGPAVNPAWPPRGGFGCGKFPGCGRRSPNLGRPTCQPASRRSMRVTRANRPTG